MTRRISDPMLDRAIAVIKDTYGLDVKVESEGDDLLKFGRNNNVKTAIATVMTLPSTINNETYVSTNIIEKFASSNASDTEELTFEGHTISGGIFTKVIQQKTLTGQTEVSLDTPLARVQRIYTIGNTDLLGNIALAEAGAFTAGVPDDAAQVHIMIRAGMNQTEKAAATLANGQFWIVTGFTGEVLTKAASFAEVELEIRFAGKVFRQLVNVSCSGNHSGKYSFKPYSIIPQNADVRLRAISDSAGGREIYGSIQGFLAS